jgi:glycerophosphoryl diester phosphodiesterase
MTPLLVFLMTISFEATALPELIAHRGESADAPENTLTAFRLAWERQVPAIELDVHLTRDGKLALSHDADTKRTGGVKKIIKECTWEELRSLDVGKWKGPEFAGEMIALVDDALAEIPEGAKCYIEVKEGPEVIAPLAEVVRKSGKSARQLPIISFQAETIAEAKRLLPAHQAYWLVKFKRDEQTKAWTPSVDEVLAKAKAIGADGLDLSWEGPWDETFVRRVRDAKLGLYVWTVDDPQVARRMIGLGVDGITTNKAAWLRQELQK